MIWFLKELKILSKINKSVGSLLETSKELIHPSHKLKTKTYIIRTVKSKQLEKQLSFIRQSIIEPPIIKEYPEQTVLKQHFIDKKHYKYIGKLIKPVLKAQLSPNFTPFNIDGFEDIIQKLSSKEISYYLQTQRINSKATCQV